MRTKFIYFITIVITLLVGIMATFLVAKYYPNNETVKTIKEVNITETDKMKPAIDKIYNAVVVLESYRGVTLISTGTGFVYKQDDKFGYIITNHHVIDGATSVKAVKANGKEIIVKVLGSDEIADIAVLSMDKTEVLQVAIIGKSDLLEIGDTLFTVGSPMGADYFGTVTKGILSGKDRTVSVQSTNGSLIMEVIQTDAAINPGNSGGPLLNINGEVIGVNSLKLVENTVEGMGFAIPIEIVMGSIDRLEKGETIKRPLIGAELVDVTNTYGLYYNNVYLNESIKSGAVITKIQVGSSADKVGLKKGDVIVGINSIKIDDTAHFRFNLYKFSLGNTIKIKYYRGTELSEVNILLDKSF